MTTIAYRDGVLASDSRGFGGDATPIGQKVKVHRIQCGPEAGGLFGASTNLPGFAERALDWISSGGEPDKFPPLPADKSFSALLVDHLGRVFCFEGSGFRSGPLEAPFYSVGSGERYALGAMAMGADATRAVEIAGQLDIWTGGTIHALHLHPTN